MADIVDVATRSQMMSGIRGKNTSPELLIRKALHARGFRFRIHAAHLPGKPDLLFPKYKAAVFIHGCFWHGHACRYFKIPKTRPEFWMEKIGKNQARDSDQERSLNSQGWRILVVWECAVRSMKKEKSSLLVDLIADWLVNGSNYFQIDEGTLRNESFWGQT
ncbi:MULTISPECIES: very short patch repair endonuclease [Pseudomonas]|uniref:very short patch repair endonuclease n=1 Tax=Pseudomonas TaxID=286 RepID=UPI000BB60F41|nr:MULTISPECIES: very short patch repair endonuclease [Pseudomonas]MCA5965926.1 DNA mismatch endonuclease Vsr [Pseudomonas sp. P129]MCH5536211.1 very short patch repair endonuclease [Pseudomonas syringae pv. syringae]MDU8458042.1 very short patch repair endonuclease [Pseudomonas syringae group sp. J254-4]PBP58406.1 very short patch repair endonuclease [Pseudomonas syringae]